MDSKRKMTIYWQGLVQKKTPSGEPDGVFVQIHSNSLVQGLLS